MRKLSLILGTLILCAATIQARTITPSEAACIAANFNGKGEARHIKAVAPTAAPTLVYTERQDGEDLFYIFNRPGRGFIIIAADDKAETVLAYSESSELTSIDAVPENMRAWLAGYALQIKAAKASPLASAPRHAARQQVSPMLTTKWNQSEPYNNDCPLVNLRAGGTGNAVTGCVATAMAQVMRYFRHPDAPRGDLHYDWFHTDKDLVENVTHRFTGHSFDWDNMLEDYSVSDVTDAQKAAVSVIMADAAYSVEMQFDEAGSTATPQLVPFSMNTYFGYDASAIYEERGFHDDAEWEGLICDELEAGRPVIYTGQAQSGATHTWVIDGTDGNGMYHINWGWGGWQDGYFAITGTNILNPETGGIGGSNIKESFDVVQAALFGIKPNAGGEPRVDFVSMKEEQLSLSTISRPRAAGDLAISLGLSGEFLNHSNRGTDRYCEFGLRLTNSATGEVFVVQAPYGDPILMKSMAALARIDVDRTDIECLPAGDYDVEAVFRAYTVQIVGAEMQYIGDGVWKPFRHLHNAPKSHKLKITGEAPELYLMEPVVNTSSALDHIVFKTAIHANVNIDAYIVPLMFEVASFDENGNPQSIIADPSRQEVEKIHVVMSAGETQDLWLGEWKYKAAGAELPPMLILQLALTKNASDDWGLGEIMSPIHNNQCLFIPTAATAIATVPVGKNRIRPEVYTLGGQRLADTTSGLKPGIYIINGKKVVVK